MWYAVHMCANRFLDLNFDEADIDKISIFYEIAPNFTYSQQYNWKYLEQLLLCNKFYDSVM